MTSLLSHSRWNINANGDDPSEFSSPECYACTQAGLPAFHSNRCTAGSSLTPTSDLECNPPPPAGHLSRTRVIDPRSNYVKRWNRLVLMARGVALAVDPLFLYVIALYKSGPCFYMDVALATCVTVVRTCLDALHLAHIVLQFKLAYVSSESMVIGCGKLVWDPKAIAWHYMESFKGFWLDAFVILPIPQIVIWLIEPKLLSGERPTQVMATVLLTFLFQFTPKVYHIIHLAKRLKKVTGYIFSYGNIWWRFKLNVIAYLTACHIVGGIWYVLATQRVMSCMQQQCESSKNCNLSLYCSREKMFSHGNFPEGKRFPKIKALCFDEDTKFGYGIYQLILPVYNGNTRALRILYPIYWGLNNLGSFGNNLTPSTELLELIFSCCLCLTGIGLFVTLLGNIQIFLHSIMANKKKMQLKYRDMEWWIHRRQLPHHLRKRVRHFQRCSWAAMQGLDEIDLIQNFPDGLRRDIKRHLCIDLVMKVPLFHKLDDVILDNICDLVRPLIYSKGEKIIREGDPVQRMVFLVRGRVKRCQGLSKGLLATSVLDPGAFFGDELLSWCLRRPFVGRLPSSSATFTTMGPVEAFGLDAEFLRYISEHFRYKFSSENLKRTARYYSSNWRSWGAVIIQLAWRRHRERTKGSSTPVQNWDIENRLKMYAAMFLSFKPQDHTD